MSVRLTGSHGTWSLPEGHIVIGRAKDCQLCVVDPRLSRHHAKLVITGHDVALHDLGSTNGVLLNGDRHHGSATLKNGDLIVAGPCTFFLSIDAAMPLAPRLETLARQPAPATSSPQTDTEEMSPVIETPLPPRPIRLVDGKRVDPAIAAVISSGDRHPTTDFLRPHDFTPSGNAVVKSPPGSAMLVDTEREANAVKADTLLPDTVASNQTSPLVNGPAANGHRQPHVGARDVQSSEHFRPSDYGGGGRALQLQPPAIDAAADTERRLRWLRLLAAALDGAQTLGLATLISGVIALAGYGLALHAAGAAIEDGLPRLVSGAHDGPKVGDLALTLLHHGGARRACDIADELYQLQDQAPFLMLFAACTAAVLALVLVLMLSTVAATVLKGAPHWHRRFDLVILDTSQGYYLGWGRALARWALAAVLGPASLVLAPLGRRGLHDLIAGCDVRVRRKRGT